MNRNNAKFPLQVLTYMQNLKRDPAFSFLKDYQDYLRMYYRDIICKERVARGMLIYHGMGLGKSITAAALSLTGKRNIIFIMNKSLVQNMRAEIAKYLKLRAATDTKGTIYMRGKFIPISQAAEDPETFIDSRYKFVSLNASNMKDQLYKIIGRSKFEFRGVEKQEYTLNGYDVFIDEAHNLFRAIINGSMNGTVLYDLIQKSRSCNCVFLTGTPIANHPFELSACFNMIDPGCLPDSWYDFVTHFMTKREATVDRELEEDGKYPIDSKTDKRTANDIDADDDDEDKDVSAAVKTGSSFTGDGTTESVNETPMKTGSSFTGGVAVKTGGVAHKPRNDTPVDDAIVDAVDVSTKIKNPEKFQNRIFGLVSFVSNEGLPGIPEQKLTKIRIIPMSQKQYTKYKVARDLEYEETQRAQSGGPGNKGPGRMDSPAMQKPTSGAVSSYRSKSRQYSNYAGPGPVGNDVKSENIDDAKIASNKYDQIYKDIIKSPIVTIGANASNKEGVRNRPGVSILYSQWTGLGGITSFVKYLRARGWRHARVAHGGNTYGGGVDEQIWKFEDGMTRNEYLNYIVGAADTTAADADASSTADNNADNTNANDGYDDKFKQYIIISGSVPFEQRKQFEDLVNCPNNNIGLVIVSSTGAEGLNFKRVRQVLIMEPYWNYARIAQVAARGVRTHSHDDLPEDQRNVQIFLYVSVAPNYKHETHIWKEDKQIIAELNKYGGRDGDTEIALLTRSVFDYGGILSFLTTLQRASYECAYFGREGCRVCAPDDTPLFSKNLNRDIASDNPCQPYEAAKVRAKRVTYEGVEYYYDGDELYQHNDELDGWEVMPKSHEKYYDILEEAKKRQK